jgi:Uncharacterized alpha/beta hydrolase domain (DUF2235)
MTFGRMASLSVVSPISPEPAIAYCLHHSGRVSGAVRDQPEPLEGNALSGEYPTNVYRTWLALGASPVEGRTGTKASSLEEVTDINGAHLIYVRGVGTDGGWAQEQINGATGLGVSSRIKTAYRLLSKAYRTGDRIFILGFSRGALAARSLTNMLDLCGMPAADLTVADVMNTFKEYRDGPHRIHGSVPVQYLGLWDTVAALSQPDSMTRFHLAQPTNVKAVRHAIALDEMRTEFSVVHWSTDKPIQGVTEAWFCGAHANIGGGYKDCGLSNIALFWLLAGAKRAGLPINLLTVAGFDKEYLATPADSWTEFWKKVIIIGRAIRELQALKERRRIPDHHLMHESVFDAFEELPEYEPAALIGKGELITSKTPRTRMVPWEVRDDGELE